VGREEGLDLDAQVTVAGAGLPQVSSPLSRIAFQGAAKHLPNHQPSTGIHGLTPG
jgi:hypothetical protein